MHSSILSVLAAACVAGLVFVCPAAAEPEAAPEAKDAAEQESPEADAPVVDENPDETLVKSLIGSSYSGDLDLEGWTDYGGGLVAPPIYVHLYQREDGSALVVTSKLFSKKFLVTDALIISKPWKGYAISIACTQGDDFTLRFIGDARGPDEKEWWSEVRRAWEIELPPKPKVEAEPGDEPDDKAESAAEPAEAPPEPHPGKIAETSTKGIKCTNPNW